MVAHSNIAPFPSGKNELPPHAAHPSGMPDSKIHSLTDWDSLQRHQSTQTYGLTFYPGNRISVAYGVLAPSFWHEHTADVMKLIFTFENAAGLIETTEPDAYRMPVGVIKPFQLWTIPPKQELTLHWLQKAEIVVLFLDFAFFTEQEISVLDVSVADYRPFARRDLYFSQLSEIFIKLCRQNDWPDPAFIEGMALALISRVLMPEMAISLNESAPRAGLPADLIAKIDNYIDAHIGDKISARNLAQQASLSPDHFARRFRTSTQFCPKTYVLRRKAERVRALLQTGQYNVSQAAEAVGFHDLSHLNRCFRKFFGCSPKAVIKTALPTGLYK